MVKDLFATRHDNGELPFRRHKKWRRQHIRSLINQIRKQETETRVRRIIQPCEVSTHWDWHNIEETHRKGLDGNKFKKSLHHDLRGMVGTVFQAYHDLELKILNGQADRKNIRYSSSEGGYWTIFPGDLFMLASVKQTNDHVFKMWEYRFTTMDGSSLILGQTTTAEPDDFIKKKEAGVVQNENDIADCSLLLADFFEIAQPSSDPYNLAEMDPDEDF